MDYIADLDGSLTGYSNGGFVMPSKKYALGIAECSESSVHDGIKCNSNIQIRRVVVSDPAPGASLNGVNMKVIRVTSGEDVRNYEESLFESIEHKTKDSVPKSWGLVLPTDYIYNFHFDLRIRRTT